MGTLTYRLCPWETDTISQIAEENNISYNELINEIGCLIMEALKVSPSYKEKSTQYECYKHTVIKTVSHEFESDHLILIYDDGNAPNGHITITDKCRYRYIEPNDIQFFGGKTRWKI